MVDSFVFITVKLLLLSRQVLIKLKFQTAWIPPNFLLWVLKFGPYLEYVRRVCIITKQNVMYKALCLLKLKDRF